MAECPKCGWIYISGPVFERIPGPFKSRERLRYTCKRCGYSETTPCNDAKKAAS